MNFENQRRALRIFCLPGLIAVALLFSSPVSGQSQPTSPAQTEAKTPATVPVTDGEIGPCSVELTVQDASGKPVNAALINVKIAYGFAGIRKLEMGVYTNAEGKAKFVGIPAKVHKPPLEFRASKEQFTGSGTADPAASCQAKINILMGKPVAK